jgi:hypothetical protein
VKTRLATLFAVSALLMLALFIHSCKKDQQTPPHNPYSDIKRTDTVSNDIPVDSLTVTYVHKKVFSTRCALNGCHDGHFEPDFRTPQSSFTTLVYADIVKNNTAKQYKYRVIPFDTANSVLFARVTNCCFVNTNDRMPQDNIGVPLPDSSINIIRKWIMHGARDMYGNVASKPNLAPVIQGYFALSTDYQTTYSTNRLDSIGYNPFIVPSAVSSFYIAFVVSDDSTPVNQLQVNQLKISTKPDDYSSAVVVPATYLAAGSNQVWVATVNASALPANDTLYMRYYVNDGAHPQNTEFPKTESLFPYKLYYSFIRQ